MRNSKLYKILSSMPKGGLHHIHSCGSGSVECFLELTKNDIVYFNERERVFKVAPKGNDDDGFVKCNDLRKFHETPADFDNKLREYIRMSPSDCSSKGSSEIWKHFEHKFSLLRGRTY